MNKRTPYRPDQTTALKRIEERRVRLGISHLDLYQAAGLSRNTYQRIRDSKRAFKRHITDLRFALRTIEQRRKNVSSMFEVGTHG